MTEHATLGDATTVDVQPVAGQRILLIPIGSTEQHGPHLPLATDSVIAETVARRVAARMAERVIVAPTLGYGASGEHADFAGTLSIGTEALEAVLVELGRSAGAFEQVVIVNGHGGNVAALAAALATLEAEGRDVRAWSWSAPGGDAHAGRTETSLMLAIDASLVRMDRAAPGRTEPIGALLDELRTHGVREVSPNGVLGDPTGATAEEGAKLLERLTDDLIAFMTTAVR